MLSITFIRPQRGKVPSRGRTNHGSKSPWPFSFGKHYVVKVAQVLAPIKFNFKVDTYPAPVKS